MSQRAVKWGQVERYFLRRGYEIKSRGQSGSGEKKINAPKGSNPNQTRASVVIGHTSSANSHTQVLDCYLNAIKRAFGVTREDILND